MNARWHEGKNVDVNGKNTHRTTDHIQESAKFENSFAFPCIPFEDEPNTLRCTQTVTEYSLYVDESVDRYVKSRKHLVYVLYGK